MPSQLSIPCETLFAMIGRPDCPRVIDVRIDEDFEGDPRLIPGSRRRPFQSVSDWGVEFQGQSVVIVCQKGQKLSQGTAAWLRVRGVDAVALEGGALAWASLGLPMVPHAMLPPHNNGSPTVWVTRARPKVDRIACPWLLRRFVDPDAVFLFVPSEDVLAVADRFHATPFDIEGDDLLWTHKGASCTFDAMLAGFALQIPALDSLAVIVRGADTGRPDLAPEAAGLLALSLGLSRLYQDDLEQLEAGLKLYDALFRWCQEAMEESHGWPSASRSR
ncbi:chromate resistance protein ChrB domain-containing protein [Limibacillus sp. MBR-115]|uniref:chromate resistance protein ChrB domain-containing protein n=1 Tax=Limibacillus sp. MBR-115 TaxID=3156465 RepID=UPI0033962592